MNDYHVFNGSTWHPAREAYKHNGSTWEKVWPKGIPKVNILSVEQKDVGGAVGYVAVIKWEKLEGRYDYHVGAREGAPPTLAELHASEETGDTASVFIGRSDWFGKTVFIGVVARDLDTGEWGKDIAVTSIVVQPPVPVAPTGLRATLTPGSLAASLSWTDSVTSLFTGYEVQGGNIKGGSPWNTAFNVSSNTYEFDTSQYGLSGFGESWEFRVRTKGFGTNNFSGWSSPARPGPFKDVVQQLGKMAKPTVEQVGRTKRVRVSWTPPPGPAPKRYVLQFGRWHENYSPVVDIPAGTLSYEIPEASFPGARSGDTWLFRIQAANAQGEGLDGPPSDHEWFDFANLPVPNEAPGRPNITKLTRNTRTNLRLEWDKPLWGGDYDDYFCTLKKSSGEQRELTLKGRDNGGNSLWTDLDTPDRVSTGGHWTVTLTARNRHGSGPTATFEADVSAFYAPENLRAGKVTHDSVEVLWDAVENATAYAVFSNGEIRGFTPVPDAGTNAEVTALTPNTDHVFQVVAVFDGAVSEGSEELPVRTAAAPDEGLTLPAPVVKLERNKPAWNKWQASWTSVDGATAYRLKWTGNTPEGGGHGSHTVRDMAGLSYQYTGTDLAWNETVTCQVAAVDASGNEGEWSLPQNAV
ncbi:hypothetical protein ACFY0N_30710 [Streptomyces vinaceus]|uniref:hypothetical protein n=1 Tax=Streptomyces vinaceus TaxID=1960 RepID=UPI0036CF3D10